MAAEKHYLNVLTTCAAKRDPKYVGLGTAGIRERNAWRTALATSSLMQVRGGACRRLIGAAEVSESDVPADLVEIAVEGKKVDAGGTLETASRLVHHVDDLAGDSVDAVAAGEAEGNVGVHASVLTVAECESRSSQLKLLTDRFSRTSDSARAYSPSKSGSARGEAMVATAKARVLKMENFMLSLLRWCRESWVNL